MESSLLSLSGSVAFVCIFLQREEKVLLQLAKQNHNLWLSLEDRLHKKKECLLLLIFRFLQTTCTCRKLLTEKIWKIERRHVKSALNIKCLNSTRS